MDFEIYKPISVLHCDDDPFELDRLKNSLNTSELGIKFEIESFHKSDAFKKRLEKLDKTPDVVMLDIDLGEEATAGTDLAKLARAAFPDSVIIMCSGMDDAATIGRSLKMGADDFISKKSEHAELGLRIINSYKLSQLKRGAGNKRDRLVPGIAGKTLQTISKRIPRILSSAITSVHVSGESGTGKEVIADLFASNLEESKPFVKVNCGAITPSLLESELFGHVKGAFTGASSDKRGLIETASGGWIFLDEVATLSSSAQVALLRAIENQEIIRVGDNQVRSISVKFISATNEGLAEMVKGGKFRKDLWQRLCETEIALPPLRERPDEIEPLIQFFCKDMVGGPYDIDTAAMEALCAAPWDQGNVRELRNCLRAMTELHVNKLLTPLAIPAKLWASLDGIDIEPKGDGTKQKATSSKSELVVKWDGNEVPVYEWLADKMLIELTRLHAGGKKISIRALAKYTGMSRSTISGRLKGLPEKGFIDLDELAKLVGIGD